jgi:hypothetical protein
LTRHSRRIKNAIVSKRDAGDGEASQQIGEEEIRDGIG